MSQHSNEDQAEDMKIVTAMVNSIILESEETVADGITVQQNESSIAGSSDSADNILTLLNDDCIIQVLEYLPLGDLCNAAGVCRVFEANALSVFKRRHSVLDLDELVESDGDDESQVVSNAESDESEDDSDIEWENKHMRYKQVKEHSPPRLQIEVAKKLFRHFGACIKTIALTVEHEMDEILKLMATFCTQKDAMLTKLVMMDVQIASDLIPHIEPLFNRLEFLDITGCSINQFCMGAELRELTLEDAYLNGMFTKKFEKLHTISLIDVEGSWSGIFESFLTMATQVKRLSIKGLMRAKYWSLNCLPPELEELEVDVFGSECGVEEKILNASRLQHLHVLALNCMGLQMTELFNNLVQQNVPIEELSLSDFTITANNITSLAGFSKMRRLSLVNGGWTHDVCLSHLIEGMPLLEQLYLNEFGCVTIDVIKSTIENAPKLRHFAVNLERNTGITIRTVDYNGICQLIQKRSDLTKLSLELSGTEIIMNVPAYVVEKGTLWLEVTIITFKDVERVNIVDYYDFSEDSESEPE